MPAAPRADAPAELALRRLEYGDLPSVLAVERRSFGSPWSLAMFVLELSKPDGLCLAAEGPEGLRGYLICSRQHETRHIMNVAVAPEHRRRGIATAMIESLISEIGPRASYTLEVRPSNRGAIAMYERLGFVAWGARRAYYQDNGEDALIMWLNPPSGLPG